MTMVLCQENTSNAMFQSRHSPPTTNYNFGHFSGYMPQTSQYPNAVVQNPDYGQYQMEPTAFQQAPCYMAYGSRPVEDWVSSYGMPATTGNMSPHSYSYRGSFPMGVEYAQSQIQQSNGNQSLSVLGSSPQPVCSPTASTSSSGSPGSPSNKQMRPPYDWMKKTSYAPLGPLPGKTRTKDKYRVVYSDHQRLELEKEFHYSRYITIRRKAELAQSLALSERQVKIWFQNRRAKERKQNKKREDISAGSQEIPLHGEASGVVQGLPALPGQSQNSIQPMIKQDPIDDFSQLSPQSLHEHKDGIVQSHHASDFHQTSSPTPRLQSSAPVIKMDPHDIVSHA